MIRTQISKLTRRLQKSYDVYNRIEISRSALLHNIEFFHKQTGLQVIPVLKGNAYGHGIEQVVAALKGQKLPYIAVDGYFEALKVRQFTKQPVIVMGMIKPGNFAKLQLRGLTFVVQDMETLHAIAGLRHRVKIHLELNTGMNRYGISLGDLDKYISLIKSHRRIKLEGVMAHLADPDGSDQKTIDSAVRLFDQSVDQILSAGLKPTIFHTAQSAGAMRAKSKYANAMRLGIGLYGINPYPPDHSLYKATRELKPALKLVSTISKINQLKKGDKVSYNYTFTAPSDMRIGVLPLGYHEGVNRALSNKGVVKMGTKFLPIVGRICMNHTMINLEGTGAKAGDEVIVYGNNMADGNSINSVSEDYGLFAYSLLTDLSPDVRRYLVE